jgi:hypothetical protein
MSDTVYDLGFVRGLSRPNYAEGDAFLGINNGGEQLAVLGLPERSEIVRLGKSYGAAVPSASAFTFVAVWPTTRSELVLQNGEDAGGKTYIIDRCWLVNATSQGAAQPFSLLGQLAPSGLAVALVANNAAVIRHNLLGKNSNVESRAQLCMADTTWALTNQWFILGNSAISPMTTNLGASIEAFCYGRYLIPPKGAFCLAGIAGTAAGTAICGVEWHEAQLPLP